MECAFDEESECCENECDYGMLVGNNRVPGYRMRLFDAVSRMPHMV